MQHMCRSNIPFLGSSPALYVQVRHVSRPSHLGDEHQGDHRGAQPSRQVWLKKNDLSMTLLVTRRIDY